MTKVRKRLLIVFCLLLIVAAGTVFYRFQLEQQQQTEAATAKVEEAIGQFKEKQYDRVLATLDSIPEGTLQDWRIPYYRGVTHIRLKDFESATASLEEALLLDSENTEIAFALGVAYFKLGKLGLSKSYFHTVLQLDPDNEEAKGLMDIMAKLERFQEEQPKAETEQAPVPNSH